MSHTDFMNKKKLNKNILSKYSCLNKYYFKISIFLSDSKQNFKFNVLIKT